MAYDHRSIDSAGNRISFTCENQRYRTNRSKGQPHSPFSPTLGNVLAGPLISHGIYSLWLEHVEEIGTHEEVYWLMWYRNDMPNIPMSGVFDRSELSEMIAQLTQFVP